MSRYLILVVSIIFTMPVIAASSNDIDKLTTFSTILGRATACGLNTKSASRTVGAWIDSTFKPGSDDQITYLPIFMQGVEYAAQQQASGSSPDSCASVSKTFYNMTWH